MQRHQMPREAHEVSTSGETDPENWPWTNKPQSAITWSRAQTNYISEAHGTSLSSVFQVAIAVSQIPHHGEFTGRPQDGHRDDSKDVYNKMWSVFDERTAQVFAAHLVPHVKPHHRILDVGCGRGSITMDLARLVPDGNVLGIDINRTLIDGAVGMLAKGDIPNLEFKVMDANALGSLPSENFDIIHAHQVLLHLADPIQILQQLYRMLRTGGILSLRDNASLHYYPELPMMQKYIWTSMEHARSQAKGGLFFGLWNHDACQEAGFAVSKIECSSWAWSWKDPKRFVPTAKNSARTIILARGTMTEAELDEAEREWEEWASMPHARMQGLDGAVLCWK